jgi:hypothetical protein
MTIMRLTDQQLKYFDTFGFIALPGLLTDRIDRIIDEFEAVWAEHGGGHDGQPHDGEQRSCLLPFADHSEYLCTLLDDERIEGITASILGDDFNYYCSDGNYYVGDSQWHSDGWAGDIKCIKIAYYLDPLTRDTGALRVIPGSHRLGDCFADTLQKQSDEGYEQVMGVSGADLPAVVLETRPGDILVFNHRCKHASFGGANRRRMFTMNLFERYPQSRLEDLRAYIAGLARFHCERPYGQKMIATASPQRMVHLEQVLANDDHLPALVAQHRAKTPEPSRR